MVTGESIPADKKQKDNVDEKIDVLEKKAKDLEAKLSKASKIMKPGIEAELKTCRERIASWKKKK